MADLITASTVKDRFPDWAKFCTLQNDTKTPDERLALAIDNGETEMLEYIDVTSTTINAQLERHLVNLIRKQAFDFRRSVDEFDYKPQLVRDYQASLEMLERYRSGELPVPQPEDEEDTLDVRINAKKRRFGEWFQ